MLQLKLCTRKKRQKNKWVSQCRWYNHTFDAKTDKVIRLCNKPKILNCECVKVIKYYKRWLFFK